MQTAVFSQDCPTCGRQLRIAQQYADTRVRCQHCRAEFRANGTSLGTRWPTAMMQRADELLARAAMRLEFV